MLLPGEDFSQSCDIFSLNNDLILCIMSVLDIEVDSLIQFHAICGSIVDTEFRSNHVYELCLCVVSKLS